MTLILLALTAMKITVNIDILERMIKNAKLEMAKDDSLSGVIELTQVSESDTHLGSDHIAAWVKSSYQDAQGVLVFNHWE